MALTESVVLAIFGAAPESFFAIWAIDLVKSHRHSNHPAPRAKCSIDGTVLLVTLADRHRNRHCFSASLPDWPAAKPT